jgi:hypothetical protein
MNVILRITLALAIALAATGVSAGAENSRGAPAGPPEKDLHKLALVVGNAAYANALPLANPLNDANDVCAALRKLDFEVICKLNVATKREFKDAIYEFTGKINEKTVALFYFAGHGLQIDGLNYLIPTTAALRTKSDIEDESVQINYLMSELEARRAALNIFVLDACRDNPFVSPIRGYAPTLGLASQLYAPRNSIVAMSTGPGQLSLDGTGRNGTFTKNLLKFVMTPRQSVEDMFKAVSGGTSSEAQRLGRRQDPQITTSYADKFCLAGCADKSPAGHDKNMAVKALESELQFTISQTKAKQIELETQKAALLKKQEELDIIKLNLAKSQVQRNSGEAGSDGANSGLVAAKLSELENMKRALLQKEQELNKTRDALSVQQAGIDVKDREIRTRKIEPPEDTKKPINIVPAF